MLKTIIPGTRTGNIDIPASKSMAHRYLISAALSDRPCRIECRGISKDIEATIACLNAAGADIKAEGDIVVNPVDRARFGSESSERVLPCSESGSTLRFLLPVVGALGLNCVFSMEGRLPERPMQEYEQLLRAHGMNITRKDNLLYCSGALEPGVYSLPGNISSQYFSGLLFALPLLNGTSRIIIEGRLESADYFIMTQNVLKASHIIWEESGPVITVPGNQQYKVDPRVRVEGDYSSAAFFICAGAFSKEGIKVSNLNMASGQADMRICSIIEKFGAHTEYGKDYVIVRKGDLQAVELDASMIPDLVPVISVVAALSGGTTRIFNAGRLRFKESDRISSTKAMLDALGAQVQEIEDGLVIQGKEILEGGAAVDPCKDHRIAMSAAVAACMCMKPVTVQDAECVAKSYPDFWQDMESLRITAGI